MDVQAVKTQTEEVSKKFYAASEKLYKAAAEQAQTEQAAAGAQD